MSLQNLKKTILTQAQTQANAIAADLQQAHKTQEDRIIARAQEIEDAIIRQAEHEAMLAARRKRQETELHARAGVLKAKEEELQKTQKQILANLLEEDPKPLLKALLALVPSEKGTITAGEHHAKALHALVKDHTIAKETIPNEGGFIFTGKTAELNVTLSHVVASVFRKHRARIAGTLFS